MTHQYGHKQLTPSMQDLKDELYLYAKSALRVYPYF
jgi:hypothetical protein